MDILDKLNNHLIDASDSAEARSSMAGAIDEIMELRRTRARRQMLLRDVLSEAASHTLPAVLKQRIQAELAR